MFRLLVSAVFFAAMLFPLQADDKGEAAGADDFIREFLREQPRFRISGIITIKKPGKPPVECGARIRFDRNTGAVFAYNTTGDEPEPWDFYFWNKNLALFVYNRDRSTVVKSEWLGAPYRPAFNFIWDVLREAEKGAGFRTLLFSGLMQMDMHTHGGITEIFFVKRFGPISVEKISFTFDENYRLRAMQLTESTGATYSFKAITYEKLNKKLPRPNIKKQPNPWW